jgi:hypothetical protein
VRTFAVAAVLLGVVTGCGPSTTALTATPPASGSSLTPSPGAGGFLPPPASGGVDVLPERPSWRSATILPADGAAFTAASLHHGIVAGDRMAWVTADGTTWRPAESFDGTDPLGLVSWNGRLVSWAIGGLVQTSADGLRWKDAATGPGESNLTAMLALPDALTLFGESIHTNDGAWRSVDGSTWSPLPDVPTGIVAATIRPGGGLITVGAVRGSAATWWSPDGMTWQFGGTPDAGASQVDLTGVAATSAGVVAIGAIDGNAAAWSSRDLGSWTPSAAVWGREAFLESVTTIGGTFVIAGRRNSRPTIWTSFDGRAWSAIDLPIPAATEGGASLVRIGPGGVTVFGYTTEDAGNGGESRTGYLVWVLGT